MLNQVDACLKQTDDLVGKVEKVKAAQKQKDSQFCSEQRKLMNQLIK